MTNKDDFLQKYVKYIQGVATEKINKIARKSAKRFKQNQTMELDGVKVMLQKGACGNGGCFFSKERTSKVSGKYIGRVCVARFHCYKILKELHGEYHFIKIEGGV